MRHWHELFSLRPAAGSKLEGEEPEPPAGSPGLGKHEFTVSFRNGASPQVDVGGKATDVFRLPRCNAVYLDWKNITYTVPAKKKGEALWRSCLQTLHICSSDGYSLERKPGHFGKPL